MKNKLTKFPAVFWIANTSELFERLAWYGFYMVFAIYLTSSLSDGGLGFTQAQKGWIMGIGTGILYALPVITGSFADKFGYKKMMLVSFFIYAVGFLLLSQAKEFYSVMLLFILVAMGGALFKPIVSATIAKTTNDKTSSIGFGIFYMIVNIGSFIGPLFTSRLRETSWSSVFIFTASVFIINTLLVVFFYKEPDRTKRDKSEKILESIKVSFSNILSALKDVKFLIFLIIITGFWAMYFQLFYSLPVFIEQWINTKELYIQIHNFSPFLANVLGSSSQNIPAEKLTNIDAFYIIVFQLIISGLVARFKPLNAMLSGILIASIGVGLMFYTNNGLFLFLSIFVFSVGEMSSSPKITEYIGKIAPKDKVALYIGMSYLPVAGGSFLAGILSGDIYMRIADKVYLLKNEALSLGINISDKTQNLTELVSSKLGISSTHLSSYLWDKYHPYNILWVFMAVGIITTISLFIYDRLILRK